MIWILMLILILILALLPVTMRITLHYDEDVRLILKLQALGFHVTREHFLSATDQGYRLVRADGRTSPTRRTAFRSHLRTALHGSKQARRFLHAHLHLMQLDGLILVRTADAGLSALLSGALQGILSCLCGRAPVCLQVWPAFFRPRSTAHVRCIIRFCPGTLILTAGLLLPGLLRELHPTESEVSAYGTSHR